MFQCSGPDRRHHTLTLNTHASHVPGLSAACMSIVDETQGVYCMSIDVWDTGCILIPIRSMTWWRRTLRWPVSQAVVREAKINLHTTGSWPPERLKQQHRRRSHSPSAFIGQDWNTRPSKAQNSHSSPPGSDGHTAGYMYGIRITTLLALPTPP